MNPATRTRARRPAGSEAQSGADHQGVETTGQVAVDSVLVVLV